MRLLSLFVALALSGCSVLDALDPGMSADGANAFAKQIGGAFSNGMQGATPVAPAAAPSLPEGVPVNVQVTHRTNCTAGGHIEVLGNLTGNIDDRGTGMLLLQVTETISDWKCIGDLVINGDPYVSVAGSMAFLNGQRSSTSSFSFGGGFKWGTASKDSCEIHLTMLLRLDNTASLSGTVCGHIVNVEV